MRPKVQNVKWPVVPLRILHEVDGLGGEILTTRTINLPNKTDELYAVLLYCYTVRVAAYTYQLYFEHINCPLRSKAYSYFILDI